MISFIVIMVLSIMTMSAQNFFKRVGKNVGKMVEYSVEDRIYSAVDGLLNGSSYRYGYGPLVVHNRNAYRNYRYGSRFSRSDYCVVNRGDVYEVLDSRGRCIKELDNIEPDLTRLFTEYGVTNYRIIRFDYMDRYHSTYYRLSTDRGMFDVSAKGNIYEVNN